MTAAEEVQDLQKHTQRALAAAHLIDHRLESPASARVIGAYRAALESVVALVAEQQSRFGIIPAPPVQLLPPADPKKAVEAVRAASTDPEVERINAEMAAYTRDLEALTSRLVAAEVETLKNECCELDADLRAGRPSRHDPQVRDRLRVAQRRLAKLQEGK